MKPYVVITSIYVDDIEHQAAELVGSGYAPVGGISVRVVTESEVSYMTGETIYAQAMYKKPTKTVKTRGSRKSDYTQWFEDFWKAYPTVSGANKKKAYAAWNKRLGEGVIIMTMIDGLERYKAFIEVTERWVMHPATFLGPDNNYLLDWAIPQTPETLPKDNDQLVNWATQKGYRSPHPGESFPEYRRAVETLYRSKS